MYYTKNELIEAVDGQPEVYANSNRAMVGVDGTTEIFASMFVDRTNVYFAGMTGKGGRVAHLINGSRFFCGRKFTHAPFIFDDNGYTLDEFNNEVREIRTCDRCFSCMTKVQVGKDVKGQIKMDVVRLGQMHFEIISEAIANSILLSTDAFDGTLQGMAIAKPEYHEKARNYASNVVLNAFNLKGRKGAHTFPLNDGFSNILDKLPDSVMDLLGVGSAMMRYGKIIIVKPRNENSKHLMVIANSSTLYYMACDIKINNSNTSRYGNQYEVTPLPYDQIDYNKY